MNRINPAKLQGSKWTAVAPANKEKHFIVTQVTFDEKGTVTNCELEAVISGRTYRIDWHSLKDDNKWKAGWK
jgi:tryptophan-rich hypothetical protein